MFVIRKGGKYYSYSGRWNLTISGRTRKFQSRRIAVQFAQDKGFQWYSVDYVRGNVLCGEPKSSGTGTRKRVHEWSGAGHVCKLCGGIKDGTAEEECPKASSESNIWVDYYESGWYLQDTNISNVAQVSRLVAKWYLTEGVRSVVVLPAHLKLGDIMPRDFK